MLAQCVIGANGAHAAGVAGTVARFLSGDSVDGAKVWDRSLSGHLSDRLDGVPRTASSEELFRWANAVPRLGDAIPEAVRLLSGRNIGIDDEWFSGDMPEEVLQAYGPTLIGHFVERISSTSGSSMIIAPSVRRLIGTFQEGLGNDAVQPLVDAARENGILDDRAG